MFRAGLVAWALAACGGDSTTPIDAAPTTPWSQGPDVPTARLEPGVTAIGQRVVVLGGFSTGVMAGNQITMHVDVFDAASSTWSSLPDAPVAWIHVQLAAVGASLYLLGGATYESLQFVPQGTAWRLDTADPTASWQPIAAMPAGQERDSAAVVVAPPNVGPGRIYLLGGGNATVALSTNLFYDTIANTWGQLPPLPVALSHAAAMIRPDGTLVVAGGLAGLTPETAVNTTWILPVGATQWQQGAPMLQAKGGCAYGVVQTLLVCAGGEGGNAPNYTVFSETESYDFDTNVWTLDPPMPMTTGGTQGAVVGARLFVPGGARFYALEPTSTLFIYAPLDTAMP
jgi:N-acetylneuraminic acid mutarotase